MEDMMATPARYDDNPEPEQAAPGGDEDFDLAQWVEGVTPVTHAVALYARGDLLADLDLVTARIDQARREHRDNRTIAPLRERAKALADTIRASELDVVVQGWSQDRVEDFQRPLKEVGMSNEDVVIEQVCAQVVSPKGFTPDLYRQLDALIHPQVEQIAGAVFACNLRVPVVSVPS
jgi:hypothetical protein